MYRIEMPKSIFERIKARLPEIYPDIMFNLVVCDDALENLGFVNDAPCIVDFYINEERYDELLDDLLQFEVDAFNTVDGCYPDKNDSQYQDYLKYGWMWDWFFHARRIE
ncbi:MAG: hypothetical protein ACI4JA_11195 [Oscillospiraceae bacterium]